jgi:FkbM family methyltransferase
MNAKGLLMRRPGLYLRARRYAKVARFLMRRPHEPEFEMFRYLGRRPGRPFLDIGANTGQSAMSFRIYDRTTPIISLEPNPALAPELRFAGRFLRDFAFHIVGTGAEPGSATLFVPVVDGIPLSGEASTERRFAADVWWGGRQVQAEIEEVTVRIQRVDDLGLDPAFVKIDNEGAVIPTLEGMRATIERSRPTFLIEGGPPVVEWMAGVGYTPRTYVPGGTFAPWDERNPNMVFLSHTDAGAARAATG